MFFSEKKHAINLGFDFLYFTAVKKETKRDIMEIKWNLCMFFFIKKHYVSIYIFFINALFELLYASSEIKIVKYNRNDKETYNHTKITSFFINK